eukprot:TRINITY_DN10174_c0_g1_i1.p3 TRINITY_DN10174_c0_g1~~TRINITY_DN10174_c0_g1_i1.p3  ORF type:complete len:125 (-),score=15.12 TRINITY_DN10174_c0_g1_i1:33-407(-)
MHHEPQLLSSLPDAVVWLLVLAHGAPAVVVVVELLSEKHLSMRRLFSETLAAFLGGVVFSVWSVVFRSQSGPLGAEQYLYALAVPLGVAYGVALPPLFVGAYFVARVVSRWRWRHVIEFEELLE